MIAAANAATAPPAAHRPARLLDILLFNI